MQQDGPSASLTAPNGSSQRRLIESVSRAITDKNGNSSLEAHGTGTALGDPIEVGAAVHALCTESTPVQCTSLKSNLGHLEAAAAAAGLSSLIVGSLLAGAIAINAQLRGLNVHLSSIVSSKPFQMPVEVLPRATYTHRMSRLSSFGFSGTIAHGAFDIHRPAVADKLIISSATSIYRAQYSHEGLRVKHFRRLASFHSSRRDTSKAMPEVQSAMYCR